MNTDTAFLSLDTFSLTGTTDINATKTNFIFRNVNLKNVMGEMWDKYEKFAIRPVGVRYNGAVQNSGSQAYVIQNNLRGLDWINCYDEKYGTGQVYMPVASCTGANGAVSLIPTNSNYCFNFRKGSPIVNLEIQITNQGTNGGTGTPTGITGMPDQNYLFQIQPAENNQNEMGYMGLYTNQLAGTPIISYPSKIISDAARTYTYNGFDMRRCCSEFWDKYENFEIVLAGYQYQGYGATSEQQDMPIILRGFNWVNNWTKEGATSSTSDAVVGITKSPNSGSSHFGDFTMINSPIQFKKTSSSETFTIQFRNFDNSGLNGGLPTITGGVSNRIAYLAFFIRPIKPESNPEKATLSISSADLSTNLTNLGIRDANYTDITINNVDLRAACQGFWDKYNKFNIFLTGMYPNSSININAERCLMLYCEGLQLDPQVKYSNPQQTSQTWVVGPLYAQSLAVSGNFPLTFGNTHGTMFYKSLDRVNLRFFVGDIGLPSSTIFSEILRGTLTFTIVPCQTSHKVN